MGWVNISVTLISVGVPLINLFILCTYYSCNYIFCRTIIIKKDLDICKTKNCYVWKRVLYFLSLSTVSSTWSSEQSKLSFCKYVNLLPCTLWYTVQRDLLCLLQWAGRFHSLTLVCTHLKENIKLSSLIHWVLGVPEKASFVMYKHTTWFLLNSVGDCCWCWCGSIVTVKE